MVSKAFSLSSLKGLYFRWREKKARFSKRAHRIYKPVLKGVKDRI